MKHLRIRQIISNCLFMTEFIALFFLVCAVIQGNIGFLPGMGYGILSFFFFFLLTSLLLRHPSGKKIRKLSYPKLHTGLSLRVASNGNRNAA